MTSWGWFRRTAGKRDRPQPILRPTTPQSLRLRRSEIIRLSLAAALGLALWIYLESRTDLGVLETVVALTCLVWIALSIRERWDWILWIAAIGTVLAIGVTLSWVYWEVLHSERDSVSTTVRNLGLLIGGAIAILLAAWRSKVAERQADTAHEGLLNERYQKGAEMLGNEVLSVRLGGIYALQHLASEDPEQYHIQVMKLFCAFVRNPTEKTPIDSGPDGERKRRDLKLREDVQAVITAIGERSRTGLALEKATENFRLALHDVRLSGADLREANLANAYLGDANMLGASLSDSNLSQVHLPHGDLSDAVLRGADLTGALIYNTDMSNADMQDANLSKAHLLNTDLQHANLKAAKLSGANLQGANLSAADLSGAILHDTNLSGAVFGKGTRPTPSVPPISEDVFVRLTQSQLDDACADSANPPKIAEGTVDIETGKPLVWRGKPCQGSDS